VNVRYLALAAALLCVSSYGETPAPPTNPLDAAKRDLRDLPATERPRDILGKSPGFGAASLPAVALPGSSDSPQNKPDPNAPPSPTWLQDALQQTDAERSQRESAVLARDRGNGYKPVPATDPLAQYLGQWLAPRDQELLKSDARKTTDQKGNGPLDLTAQNTQRSGLDAWPTSADAKPVAINEPAKNPYLQDEAALPPVPLNSYAPVSVMSLQQNDRSRVPSALPLAAVPTGPDKTASSARPVAKPLEPVSALPTAPIIDDRKYFPQLRRF